MFNGKANNYNCNVQELVTEKRKKSNKLQTINYRVPQLWSLLLEEIKSLASKSYKELDILTNAPARSVKYPERICRSGNCLIYDRRFGNQWCATNIRTGKSKKDILVNKIFSWCKLAFTLLLCQINCKQWNK